MNCEQVLELLSEYTDGFLPKATAEQVEAHLQTCTDCKKEADALFALRAQIRALRLDNTDDFVLDTSRLEQPKVVPLARRAWVRSLGAVAACFVLFIGIYTAVDRGYHAPEEAEMVLYDTADDAQISAVAEVAEIAPDVAPTHEDVVSNNKPTAPKQRMIVSDTSAVPVPTQEVGETIPAYIPEGMGDATSVPAQTETEPTEAEQTEVPPAKTRARSGGGAGAPQYTKRVVTLSVSDAAQELFMRILSGVPQYGTNGETVVSDADLSLLLCIEGVSVTSDVSQSCDTDAYVGKVALIY